MKTMKEEATFVTEFKTAHPIRETSGTGTGTFKWIRYSDGLDLRFGNATQAAARRERARAARENWVLHCYNNEMVPCPICGKHERRITMEIGGVCDNCMMVG